MPKLRGPQDGVKHSTSAGRRERFATFLSMASAALLVGSIACGGGGDGPSTPKVATIRVDPGTATADVNGTTRFVATPVDKNGNVVVTSTLQIAWASLTPAVASVDASGLATALTPGTATIEASSGSFRGTATLTVTRPPLATVTITPGSASLFRGDTVHLRARTLTGTGTEVTDRTINWTSSNDAAATVAGAGATAIVTARGPGAATITATSETKSSSISVTVGADGVIAFSSPGVALTVARLAVDPSESTVSITNSGGGVLRGLTTTIAYGQGQPTGWLTATLSATQSPATVTLQGRAQQLPEGVVTANVVISSTTPGVASKSLPVTLTVGAGPRIALSTTTVPLSSFVGGPQPVPQTVTITNGGGATLSGLATGTPIYGAGATGWLQLGFSSTTAPAALSVGANTNGLAAGTYTATVPVTSSLSGVTAQLFSVTLTVAPAPVIALDRTSVPISGAVNGSAPAPQQVAVTNAGGGTLSGLSLGATTYGAGASGWLTASITPATAPATITLTASLTGLAVGAYQATVPVQSSISSVTPRTITVTLTVTAGQIIALAPPNVSLTATSGGAVPANRIVSVTNGGTGSLTGLSLGPITYGGGPGGWLSASLAAGSAPTSVTLGFAAVPALAIGNYTATFEVRSSQFGVAPAPITVTLGVQSGAVIGLTSYAITFVALTGGNNPSAQSIGITNSGTGSLTGLSVGAITYTAGPASGWLQGSLAATSAPSTLTLTPTTLALAAGSYAATVVVESSLPGVAPQTVNVALTVNASTTMAVSQTSVTMNAPNGGGNPAAVIVSVTNTGSSPLTGLVATVSYTSSTPTFWLLASLASNTGPTNLTLSANVASLPHGTYTATVAVTSPVALNSPRNINVTLVVPPPTIGVSATSGTFTATQGTGAVLVAPSAVSITNTGGGLLTGMTRTVTCAAGWLTGTLSSTSAPASLSLGLNAGSAAALARGTYTCTISIAAPGATNSPVIITVSLVTVYTYNQHIASLWTRATAGGQTCANGGCHGSPYFKVDLITGDVYARILTQVGTGGVREVLPGFPGSSLMYLRTASTSSPMPTLGVDVFTRDRILGWITDGAIR